LLNPSIAAVAAAGTVWLASAAPGAQSDGASGTPTFTRDVAPIFYKNCAGCHRPGEMGPMPLLTYDQSRPYARAIRTRVENGTMPPWHAEEPAGTFLNDRRLSARDKETIVRWASNGAPQGDTKDLPKPPVFTEGWSIGTPDVVLSMPTEFEVPAAGTIDYQDIRVPTNFTEDKWVQAIELRSSSPSVVHHILVFGMDPVAASSRSDPFRLVPLPNGGNHGVELPRPQATGNGQDRPAAAASPANAAAPVNGAPAASAAPANAAPAQPRPARPQPYLVASLAPGLHTQVMQPDQALLVRKGTLLNFQIHYTAKGTVTKDRSSLGLIFAKEPPRQQVRSSQFMNPRLILPAGSGNQRVDAAIEFTDDAHIVSMIPHTHLRGKSWEYTMTYPDGRSQVILSVPKYDFNWQTSYVFANPVAAPKGSRLIAVAHYDNSPGNRANPDPTATVRWGEQTWEEMQYTGISYIIDKPQATTAQGQP
jgi:mono/diheme cytochrome c family protein